MLFSRQSAKAQRKSSGCQRSSFAALRLGARNLLLVFLASLTVYSQPQVNFPDVTKLEPEVRDQITALQNSLTSTLKNPRATGAEKSEAYGKLAQVYHAYSLTAPARESYLAALNLSPKDFRWNYLLGRLEHQEVRFEYAIKRYEEARTLRPDYLAVHVNLGNVRLELNRLDDAKTSFMAALEIDASNPAAHYGLGQVAISKRDYVEAISHFEKTLAQVPNANRVNYALAMAYRGLGDATKAKTHLAQQGSVGVRVADPLFDGLQEFVAGERVYLARGKLAFEAGRYAEAAAEFRKAVAAKPDSVTALINFGAALTQAGDVKGAAEQFEAALRIEPGKVNAHYNLAVLLAGENKHSEAISHLRSALRAEPNDLNARLLLARELSKSEQLEESLVEFSRVAQTDPNIEGALLDQVNLLYRMERFKQALETLEKGHAQFPQRGRTIVTLAFVLATSPAAELRNGARAFELAQRVYQTTGAPQHGALVATALAELGQCSEAAGWQRRMISAAEQSGQTGFVAELKSTLKHYESTDSCRPASQTILPQP
jgi:tetratricopeptide (TPR) repeat protein